MSRVAIINHSASHTGLGRYATDLMEIAGTGSAEFSMIYNDRMNDLDFPGQAYRSVFPRFFTSGWYINVRFQHQAYKKLESKVKKMYESGYLVHYVDPLIKPFTNNEKSIVTIHDFFFLDRINESNYRSLRYAQKNVRAYKKFSHVLAVSNHVKNQALAKGFEGEITVINPPVSRNFYHIDSKKELRAELGLPEEKILILSIGDYIPRKNLDVIPETLRILGDRYNLVRIGKSIASSITFEKIGTETVNKIYNACDVLLLPSLDEGYGFPVVESMATGLPVVASDIEIMKEIAGDAAILVPPKPNNLADGIRDALLNKEKLIELGFKRAPLFSFEHISRQMIEYYDKISNQI